MHKLFKDEIVVVSGLPRSGTSLVMTLLQDAGLQLLIDNLRLPDEDNPAGYFEYSPVKNMRVSTEWIILARGKVVKVVSPLLSHLPPDEKYRIVLMLRNCEEVYASQQTMLKNRGHSKRKNRNEVIQALTYQINEVQTWLNKQSNMMVHTIYYPQLVFDPFAECRQLCKFLGLNENVVESLVGLVDPQQYRHRISIQNNQRS